MSRLSTPAIKRRKTGPSGLLLFFGLVAYTLVMGVAYIWIDRKNDNTKAQIKSTSSAITMNQSRQTNLEADLEAKTQANFIYAQVRRFNLDLRPASPSQVRELSHFSPKNTGEPGRAAVDDRSVAATP